MKSLPRFSQLATACLLLGLAAGQASAAVITQWNFNVNATGTNNNPVPSTGVGTAQMVGMTNNIHAGDFPNAFSATTASSDPAVAPAPDLSWRVRGNSSNQNGWSGTTSLLSGAQFNASTVGFKNISLSFDINATDGSPRHAQLQYTLDGSNFISFGPLFDFNPTNDRWANGLFRDLSPIPGANNNPNFGFKIVSAFSPVGFTDLAGFHAPDSAFQRANASTAVYNGTAGNYRFDMVTFSGIAVPEPTSFVLLGFALCGMLATRRR